MYKITGDFRPHPKFYSEWYGCLLSRSTSRQRGLNSSPQACEWARCVMVLEAKVVLLSAKAGCQQREAGQPRSLKLS